MNGWNYVEGNPINFIDPIGFFKCNPVTGQCDKGYGLCVVNGVWQGAYVNGKPCIVTPSNVREINTPSRASSPPSPSPRPLFNPSMGVPDCGPNKPCNVIVGAKQLGDTGGGGGVETLYHAFILVADPNRQAYPDLGFPHPGIFNPYYDPSGQLPNLINDSSTVYFFRGGPGGKNRLSPFGNLETKYGYYRENTEDYLPLGVKYTSVGKTPKCHDAIQCFKNVMDLININQIPYWPWAENSNATVYTALRRCGFSTHLGFLSSAVLLTSWGTDLDLELHPSPQPVPTPAPIGTPMPRG